MNPRSTIQIAGHPIHVMLVPFVIGYYTGAFAADLGLCRPRQTHSGRGLRSG